MTEMMGNVDGNVEAEAISLHMSIDDQLL